MPDPAHAEFRTLLKQLLKRDTKAFKAQLDGDPVFVEKLSDKAKALHKEIVKREFGDIPKESITALMSAFIGEELPAVKQTTNWIFTGCGCIAIKVIKQPDFTGREAFKPGTVLARLPGIPFDGRTCYNEAFATKDGSGTSQAFLAREQFEFATDADIAAFIDSISDGVMTNLRKGVVIISKEDLGK